MRPMFRSLLIVLVVISAVAGQNNNAKEKDDGEKTATDLPVKRVVMFSSGVGYFEHADTLRGDQRVQLTFTTDQINDVLKSLVAMDPSGAATSVNYPSREPLERALQSFGVDISGNPSLPELLNQLRGARITIEAPERISGHILHVEPQVKVVGEPPAQITEHVLTLVTETGIRTIPLSTVQNIQFADEKLQKELNEALMLLANFRDTSRKPVTIDFIGEGQRQVRVGYLVEAPIWKSTYRLDLSGEKPLLQGWAVVENTTDSDWENVTLSLVSGRPISFVQDLYTPLYMPRPTVIPELYASLQPRLYEEGIARGERELAQLQAASEATTRLGRSSRTAGKEGRPAATPAPAAPAMDVAAGVRLNDAYYAYKVGEALDNSRVTLGTTAAAAATASDLGELFEFTIAHPVDLGRRRSAMLPIVNQSITAERVSIYNQAQLAKHPLNGVWVTNDSGMKLLSGPVTVFDDGAYAGDAQVGNLTQGEKALLSYAVDLAVAVDPSVTSSSELVSGTIVKGVLHLDRRHTYTQTYIIENKAKDKRTLIIEHPFNNDRKLVEPEKPAEKTPAFYRFRVPVGGEDSGKFVVKEVQPITQTFAIIGTSPDVLLTYVRGRELSKDIREALGKAAAMMQELSTMEAKLAQSEQQLRQLQDGQERLRQNINTVGRDSTLGKRYLQKLGEEEDQIEKMQIAIEDLREQIEAKRAELANYLNGLTIE